MAPGGSRRRLRSRVSRKRKRQRLEDVAKGQVQENDIREACWPAVTKARQARGWTDADAVAVRRQLGYVPGNAVRVAVRVGDLNFAVIPSSDSQVPVVLELYPLVVREATGRRAKSKHRIGDILPVDHCKSIDPDWVLEPFPTLFWLVHDGVRALISQLEQTDLLRQWREQLDHGLMRTVHESYGKERWELLSATDKMLVQDKGWQKALDESRGVAGMLGHGIKSLHAHTAHYWSGCKDNILGRWVDEELSRRNGKERQTDVEETTTSSRS